MSDPSKHPTLDYVSQIVDGSRIPTDTEVYGLVFAAARVLEALCVISQKEDGGRFFSREADTTMHNSLAELRKIDLGEQ